MKCRNLISRTAICLYLVLACVLCVGCDGMSPKFLDSDEPFVIHEIKGTQSSDNMIWYYCKSGCDGMIIDKFKAPKGLFNIGDTVVVCKANAR